MAEEKVEFPAPLYEPAEATHPIDEPEGPTFAPYLEQSYDSPVDATSLGSDAVFLETIEEPLPAPVRPEQDAQESAAAVQAINDPANDEFFEKWREEQRGSSKDEK